MNLTWFSDGEDSRGLVTCIAGRFDDPVSSSFINLWKKLKLDECTHVQFFFLAEHFWFEHYCREQENLCTQSNTTNEVYTLNYPTQLSTNFFHAGVSTLTLCSNKEDGVRERKSKLHLSHAAKDWVLKCCELYFLFPILSAPLRFASTRMQCTMPFSSISTQTMWIVSLWRIPWVSACLDLSRWMVI